MPPLETVARALRRQEEQAVQNDSLAAFIAIRKRTLTPEEDDLGVHERRIRRRREETASDVDHLDSCHKFTLAATMTNDNATTFRDDQPVLKQNNPLPSDHDLPTTYRPEIDHNAPLEPVTVEDPPPGLGAATHDLRTTAAFIEGLKNRTLDQINIQKKVIERLRDAPSELPDCISDRHFLKALGTFLATADSDAPEAMYNGYRTALLACYPDDPFLSFDQVKRQLEIITGVTPIVDDVCVYRVSASLVQSMAAAATAATITQFASAPTERLVRS
ncbi:hypothetical protein FPV67DRAFT_1493531 [Lyophyllum atratum]|nr:hypothetical protein FPV67DRAFT_1493531 [Lyophyllum atratum]